MSCLPNAVDDQALTQIEEAYSRFQNIVTREDDREFRSVQLKDVRDAALDIQKRLAAKRSSRNLHRLKPLLDGMDRYSKAVDVLCNGTDYLPFIWAPIKLFLQIACDHLAAFEKLIAAYADIAEALPRFDILAAALKDHPDFQKVLSAVYCDILEFHRRAYKVFRANAWKRFFDSSWARFDFCFTGVLESLRRHSELVDKEANAFNILSLQDFRQRSIDEIAKREQERLDQQFENVISWLDTRDYDQENHIEELSSLCHQGTADWLFADRRYEQWLFTVAEGRLLWIHGKPGSGKSVLCSQTIERLHRAKLGLVVQYVHDYKLPEHGRFGRILRSLVCQMIRQNRNLAGFVDADYIRQGSEPSIKTLTELLLHLASGSSNVLFVIDGLDECKDDDIRKLLALLAMLVKSSSSTSGGSRCKVAVFSRNIPVIQKITKKWPTIALGEEKPAVDAAMRVWVHSQLNDLQTEQDHLVLSASKFRSMEETITAKADGMFLWVRLMLATLQEVHTVYELEQAVQGLPPGLDQAYGRILRKIDEKGSDPKRSFKARNLMAWIALTDRPMRSSEIMAGLTLGTEPYLLNERTKVGKAALDLIRPLVEVRKDGTVSFVHFTVKEYILDKSSTDLGPFLDSTQGNRHIAHACAAYLRSCLDLVDPDVSELQIVDSIVRGFHCLSHYVFGYWKIHWKRSEGEDQSPKLLHDMLKICAEISERHKQLLRQKTLPELENRHTSTSRAPNLTHYLLLFGHVRGDTKASEDVGGGRSSRVARASPEPVSATATLFHQARVRYQEIAQVLHSDEYFRRWPNLDTTLVTKFREEHENSAYTCRFEPCARQYDGFGTIQARDDHECSHKRIMCTENSCPFASGVGFRTGPQLRKHVQTYHLNDPQPVRPFVFGGHVSGQGIASPSEAFTPGGRLPKNSTELPIDPTIMAHSDPYPETWKADDIDELLDSDTTLSQGRGSVRDDVDVHTTHDSSNVTVSADWYSPVAYSYEAVAPPTSDAQRPAQLYYSAPDGSQPERVPEKRHDLDSNQSLRIAPTLHKSVIPPPGKQIQSMFPFKPSSPPTAERIPSIHQITSSLTDLAEAATQESSAPTAKPSKRWDSNSQRTVPPSQFSDDSEGRYLPTSPLVGQGKATASGGTPDSLPIFPLLTSYIDDMEDWNPPRQLRPVPSGGTGMLDHPLFLDSTGRR